MLLSNTQIQQKNKSLILLPHLNYFSIIPHDGQIAHPTSSKQHHVLVAVVKKVLKKKDNDVAPGSGCPTPAP